MPSLRSAARAGLLLHACGCSSGVPELQRCIDHSVEEGVSRDRAEQGCRDALAD